MIHDICFFFALIFSLLCLTYFIYCGYVYIHTNTQLDRTHTALIAALITSVGGPLCELPFIASGCWHYIPSAADYYPLDGLILFLGQYYNYYTNDSSVLSDLSLSSITAPCYFAVTTDAIALGRWFDDDNNDRQTNRREFTE
jgi:hypothetical protein